MYSRRYALLHRHRLVPSLFPFLSIFLCVMGVLSFLNMVSSTISPNRVLLSGDVSQGYKVGHQILCLPEGLVAVPPVSRLRPLQDALPNAGLLHKREELRAKLQANVGELALLAQPTDEQAVLEMLREIAGLNRQARDANVLYEEFLLFGIYPGGGAVYHQVRKLLMQHPELGLQVGMEPLDADWQLSLDE